MGPRARRRAIAAAIGLGAVAAVTGAILVTRSPSQAGSPGQTTPGGAVFVPGWPITEKLTFGMTKQQVRSRVGKPTTAVRDETGLSCWQYTVNKTYQGLKRKSTLDAVRVCFFSGAYTIAHYEFDGKWDYKPEKITA